MPTGRPRIRGWIGEQSFEIAEGFEHLEMIAEAMVFSAAYRVERKLGVATPGARDAALNAVLTFRKTRE